MTVTRPGPVAEPPLLAQLNELTGALEEFSASLDRVDQLAVLLHDICGLAIRAVPDVELASVTVFHDGVPETAACTGERAKRLDAAQYAAGEGPGLDAARTGAVARVDADGASEAWPRFAANVPLDAVTGFLSAPLVVQGGLTGSVNLYASRQGGFDEVDAAWLELLVAAVEVGLRARQQQAPVDRGTVTDRPVS